MKAHRHAATQSLPPWEAPRRDDGLRPGRVIPPVLLDHASTSALTTGVTAKHVNRLPSTAERTTSSLSRGFHASNCPIGLSGDSIVGLAQGRVCGVERRKRAHGPICKRSRTLGKDASCRCTDVYEQPLRSGGDSAARYMTRCTSARIIVCTRSYCCTSLMYPLPKVEFFRGKLLLKLSVLGGIEGIEEL